MFCAWNSILGKKKDGGLHFKLPEACLELTVRVCISLRGERCLLRRRAVSSEGTEAVSKMTSAQAAFSTSQHIQTKRCPHCPTEM
jgi:hypothetical protein